MGIVLITNCTATQSQPSAKGCSGLELDRPQIMTEVAEQWGNTVKQHKPSITPAQLYRGIAFATVTKIAAVIKRENVFISSIGQGLVNLEQKIVPYDLSIDVSHKHSLTKIVTEEKFSPSFWWQLVNKNLRDVDDPITQLVQRPEVDMVVVACTTRFLAMLTEDIVNALAITVDGPKKLRILVTSEANLSSKLANNVIKYDSRIGIAGTGNRNDVIQRAALHFIEMSIGLDLGIDYARKMVNEALDKLAPAPTRDPDANIDAITALLKSQSVHIRDKHPDEVYVALQKGGMRATSSQFRKAWRSEFGIGKATLKKDSKNAVAALAGLNLNRSAAGTSFNDEQTALDAIKIFHEVLVDQAPGARFSSAEVHTWAIKYFESLDEVCPTQLKSVNKTAHILKTYHKELGFTLTYSAPGGGGQIYMLKGEGK